MSGFQPGAALHLLRRRLFPRRRAVAAFVSRAREQAIAVESLEGMNADIEKLSCLDGALADKRIVYLGEEDHWIHEKYEYRLLLLRYLFSRGWRCVGEELGWSDGRRINRYLATGDASELQRIATYGYRGGMRKDREDKATGLLRDSAQHYPLAAFAAEQIRFAAALRQIGQGWPDSGQLRFFGYDVNAVAAGGYEDIAALCGQAREAPVVGRLLQLLACIPGETMAEEIARLDRTLQSLATWQRELSAVLGEEGYAQLRQAAWAMRASYRYAQLANPAKNYAELNVAMAIREETMHRNLDFVLSRLRPDDKLILMGHNRHLCKNGAAIRQAGGSPPGGGRVPAIGSYLNRLLPGQVFSIWLLHDHGSSAQPFSALPQQYVSTPGTLNAILSQVGASYLLPTSADFGRGNLLKTHQDIVGIYNAVFRAAIAEQADAIFFVRTVSPLVP